CIGGHCKKGKCICSPGLTLCNGTCVDTTSNNQNCGYCGNACLDTQACVNGTCICNISGQSDCPTASACGNPQFCGNSGCVCIQLADGTNSCIIRAAIKVNCSSPCDCPHAGQLFINSPCTAGVTLCAFPCAFSQSSNLLPASSENSDYIV
ncbi:7150_t:CDS:2, partial [Gigaspora rosea]